jgi:hypothetical protein
MTKTASLSTDVQEPLAVKVTKAVKSPANTKPARISICEFAPTAFDQAAILVRNHGYKFCSMNPPMTFHNGQASINLVLTSGDDDASILAAAAESMAIALGRENAQAQRDEAAELALSHAQQEREAAKVVLALELTAAKALVKRLQAEVTA